MKNLHACLQGIFYPPQKKYARRGKGILSLAIFSLGFSLFFAGKILAQTTPASFMLRSGVVINPTENHLYFSTPEGQVTAVNISNGRTIWQRTEPGCPIAQFGGQLICFSGKSGASNTLVLENLDLERKGEVQGELKYELPENTKATFKNTLGNSFEIRGRASNGQFFLYYKHVSSPNSGLNDPQKVEKVQEKALVLRSGAFQEIPLSDLPKRLVGQSILPNANQRIPVKEGIQYLSKNRRHVLVSTRVKDNLNFDCYRWEIYQIEGKKKLGEFLTYRSFAPFFVNQQGIIVFEYGPFSRGAKAAQKTPLSLRAIDLKDGKEAWILPILDHKYRGPFPN